MAFLLDTNVVSELRKQRPDANVVSWHQRHVAADVYISVLVMGEIRQGIERIRPRDTVRAGALERWLDRLGVVYRDRLLPVTAEIAQTWGRLGPVGQPPPAINGLMVATATIHHLTLVTRNVADVVRTGVPVVNPFQPE